jgi:hypothetical protein
MSVSAKPLTPRQLVDTHTHEQIVALPDTYYPVTHRHHKWFIQHKVVLKMLMLVRPVNLRPKYGGVAAAAAAGDQLADDESDSDGELSLYERADLERQLHEIPASGVMRKCKSWHKSLPIAQFTRVAERAANKGACDNPKYAHKGGHKKGDMCNCFAICNLYAEAKKKSVPTKELREKFPFEGSAAASSSSSSGTRPVPAYERGKKFCNVGNKLEDAEGFWRLATRDAVRNEQGKCQHRAGDCCNCWTTCKRHWLENKCTPAQVMAYKEFESRYDIANRLTDLDKLEHYETGEIKRLAFYTVIVEYFQYTNTARYKEVRARFDMHFRSIEKEVEEYEAGEPRSTLVVAYGTVKCAELLGNNIVTERVNEVYLPRESAYSENDIRYVDPLYTYPYFFELPAAERERRTQREYEREALRVLKAREDKKREWNEVYPNTDDDDDDDDNGNEAAREFREEKKRCKALVYAHKRDYCSELYWDKEPLEKDDDMQGDAAFDKHTMDGLDRIFLQHYKEEKRRAAAGLEPDANPWRLSQPVLHNNTYCVRDAEDYSRWYRHELNEEAYRKLCEPLLYLEIKTHI